MSARRLYNATLMGALALLVHLCMVDLAICSSNFTDQLALLSFKSSIKNDPNNVLSNWTKETNFCGWAGVLCSRRRQRVTSLKLRNMGLEGTISPHVGNLSFLQLLDLSNNSFYGHLTNEIGHLRRLKTLYLFRNMLEGNIPLGLHHCQRLEVISLAGNKFSGRIPKELSTMPSLRFLALGRNKLIGTIPPSFGNISSLEVLGLEMNHIYGNVPTELAQLPNLNLIDLAVNYLTGANLFTGPVPRHLGDLKHLEHLVLTRNQLTNEPGSIELSFLTDLTNCTSLVVLSMKQNKLSGTLPNSVGNLSNSLKMLSVSENQLIGTIPKEIGSLRNLTLLSLAANNLNGNIPSTLGEIKSLQRLYLGGNNFHGSIPNEICLLSNLGELYAEQNKLSGSIPSCIENLRGLQVMKLCQNKLTFIPSSLWNLETLRLLNLSFNSLGGSLDPNIRPSRVLEIMDLSWNQISGSISRVIGSFQSLTSLNLSRNSFSGPIPNTMGNLITLDFLDLSHNNLSGQIPKSLEALSHIQYMNFSCNKLVGEIPNEGPFMNLTSRSFMENEALCGNPILKVPPCASNSSEKSMIKINLRYILPIIVLMLIFSIGVYIVKRNHGNNVQSQNLIDLYATTEHIMISYLELQRATDGFCEANLLGVGSYGSVYKGALSDGTIVAVKVLNLQLEGAFRSFDVECKVLRTTRHRNLVGVITTCSNPELRALVLQYMSNGSLEMWLYSQNSCLNLLQRIGIMIDVALALEYLHYGQLEPVVHCDLKPSNVLLDEDMVAHVADFGIAKILAENKTATQTRTLGTIGYIAPEYGSEGRVSTNGDIYSYGVMLLETFTRKKPTDEMFSAEINLRQWVSTSLPNKIMEIVDDGLLRMQNGSDVVTSESILLAILELGLECTSDIPTERSDIKKEVGVQRVRLENLITTVHFEINKSQLFNYL
ncbi:hypothetical protein TEA_004217 [Camellia sinensis var. sinensis]|uniref:non-specific serine/threonine protein kinase n=1 Tax=Camellia sinensis var. sinensis TaxID=542762 RepID=A0A4S4EBW6_CAMSN|nr:hypothetical protein TEA_004217 [Camellia sinensis var. sinensis]